MRRALAIAALFVIPGAIPVALALVVLRRLRERNTVMVHVPKTWRVYRGGKA